LESDSEGSSSCWDNFAFGGLWQSRLWENQ